MSIATGRWVMAWKLMLGPEGVINSLLATAGVTEEPVGLLLYSRPAVVLTLVYVWIPFATLPIYAERAGITS